MTPVILLAVLVLGPVVLLSLLRVNAALVFLSLCLGAVLTRFLGPDANYLINLVSTQAPQATSLSQSTLQLILLGIPPVLTIFFMLRTIPKGFGQVLNLFPALGAGFLTALLAVPLLPTSNARAVMATGLWQQAAGFQDLIVGGSALLCLFALLSLRPRAGEHGKRGKKHKE